MTKDKFDNKASYAAPKLLEYGDIRKLTSQATGYPGPMDSMYYLGYINTIWDT